MTLENNPGEYWNNLTRNASSAEVKVSDPMPSAPARPASLSWKRARKWGKRVAVVALCLFVLAAGAYATRRTLMQNAVRILLSRDAELIKQEREDTVVVTLGPLSSAWIAPLTNVMNEIWAPAKVRGINYYTFAGPHSWLHSYSERSNPRSPYYQAWVGAYVIKGVNGSLPADPEALARELTTLDQRSWLSAMGDPKPLAELDVL